MLDLSAPPKSTVASTDWAAGSGAQPVTCSIAAGWHGALIRRWRGVEAEITQPALDDHYVTIHLGGAKRIKRRGEGVSHVADVPCGALSIIPAGAAYHWSTEGPIDFAHIYLPTRIVGQIAVEVFDRDGGGMALVDRLGIVDPLIGSVFIAMLEEIDTGSTRSQVYLDTLFQTLAVRLLRLHAGNNCRVDSQRMALAPRRLRRVFDFMEENLAQDIGVTEMSLVAGVSQFHFSRAFTRSTGISPYAYLVARRIARAKLLLQSDLPIASVAQGCGFRTVGQFSRMFKQLTKVSPRNFQQHHFASLT